MKFQWETALQTDETGVAVKQGVGGETEWNFQKVFAQGCWQYNRCYKVINNIKIKNKLTAHNVKQKIATAFIRHATIDSNRINVEMIIDEITLSGTARLFSEKKEAERTVWPSPGVMMLDTKLRINSEVVVY